MSVGVPGFSVLNVGGSLTTFTLVPSSSSLLVYSSCLAGFSGVNCSEGWFSIFPFVSFLI